MITIKARVKDILGGTRVWHAANVALYFYHNNRFAHWARSSVPWWSYRRMQSDFFYDGFYFDAHKDPEQESGYGDVYEDIRDFAEVAGLARDLFHAERALDAGCAKGFQVRALRSAGVEAWGFDLSAYAVENAPDDVRPWLKVGDCRRMEYDGSSFDLLLVMETLEHVPPTGLDAVLDEVWRVSSRWVLATIPSDEDSRFGPDHALKEGGSTPSFFDPIGDFRPFRSLEKDRNGFPLHGHISIATQDWWTEMFTRHGFARRGGPERRVAAEVDSVCRGVWIPYVFEKAAEEKGARTQVTLRDAGWRESGGVWSSKPLALPAGRHVLCVECHMEALPPAWEGRKRALHTRAISTDGDTLYGTRLLSRRALRAVSARKKATVSMSCACPEPCEVVVQLQALPGLSLAPSPGILCRLHL